MTVRDTHQSIATTAAGAIIDALRASGNDVETATAAAHPKIAAIVKKSANLNSTGLRSLTVAAAEVAVANDGVPAIASPIIVATVDAIWQRLSF